MISLMMIKTAVKVQYFCIQPKVCSTGDRIVVSFMMI